MYLLCKSSSTPKCCQSQAVHLVITIGTWQRLHRRSWWGRLSQVSESERNEGRMNHAHENMRTGNQRAWSDTPSKLECPLLSPICHPLLPHSRGGQAGLWALLRPDAQSSPYAAPTQSLLLDLSDLKVNMLGVAF